MKYHICMVTQMIKKKKSGVNPNSGGLDKPGDLLDLVERVVPPAGTPDPVHLPSPGFEVLLPVVVPVPGGCGAVVQLAVALDA